SSRYIQFRSSSHFSTLFRSYFAEGATHDPFQTFILLANPSSEALTVRMDYLRDGKPKLTRSKTLPANSRTTVELNIECLPNGGGDRKSTRLNSSHVKISYAV